MTNNSEYWKQVGIDRGEELRQQRRAWLERQGRETAGVVWGRETSDDDPYGEDDKAYEELE